ncbi:MULTISPECIES: AAA family ATPase [unclassified Pseudoalteromonas]|uniref:McrB family protein n=1 Tax=unclassified Pseudoalteromonas TaxID=194690 RepID=UPI0011092702|nr:MULTISPECIES: AAA family ATPase [unclassified Pseudoalteromonas]TMN83533.1 restriction endonuclease [Pseudoalteromonas sp. S410]TMN88232.1 restriction endonuclease [Pseudoalteromonas sp. S408]TMN94480.1 restriction endonuclease [Pseudoalteromonas sp. S407]TMN99055.1 restriction endonuclease [Pseudoalteromonas sp. S409]TMO10015.1 restriction endonuclease [Pseudoalteromonas sp. S186]
MAEPSTVYSLNVVKDLADSELYQKLYESWGITGKKIDVWGELSMNESGNWAGVRNAKTLSGNQTIEYPLSGSNDLQSGVFLNPAMAKAFLGSNKKVIVACQLVLASPRQRASKNNPFLLAVDENTVEQLTDLTSVLSESERQDIVEDSENTLIRKAVYDLEVKETKEQIELEIDALKQSLQSTKAQTEQEVKKLEEAQGLSQKKVDDLEDVLKRLALEYEQLSEDKENVSQSISVSKAELETMVVRYRKVEESMVKKIEKLKAFIEEKAVFLKSFEFIDDDEFNSFVSNITKVSERPEHIEFSDHLNGDYKQAVSYIQAYLKERDILYSRHIIENYLTLIRSNDLIILAGDSGSGKTNLVNSFADAVGGKSIIIPVKPNWTSSEDLLGYYNPLEKKYLATPFLEALIEAQQNPEVPYFICLDEMNLARVEYYFADFLSKLEERNKKPEIQLYSDDEASHVLAELKGVVSIITGAKEKYNKNGVTDFIALMQDEDVNNEMKRAFGFSDKNSLIKYHGDIRRMLAGVISTPSSITIPSNVRIIGAINIDETTHYLSPKILDRAHIMKFRSPLLSDWDKIIREIDSYDYEDVTLPIVFNIDELGVRTPYPKYSVNDDFCIQFKELNSRFFYPLGVEFGMRTIRQGLNYLALFKDVNEDKEQAINNFIIHKVLPKFTFDGNKKSDKSDKLDLLNRVLKPLLEEILESHENMDEEFSSIVALQSIINNAKDNDGVVNYWA